MDVYICIGSACHLKGAYNVIQKLQEMIQYQNMEDQVTVKAAFCLGECTSAVSVKIDEGPVYSVSEESVPVFFEKNILRRLSS